MMRAKCVLAAALSFVIAFGGVPVSAAELVRAVVFERAGPAPVLAISAPLAAASLFGSPAASAPNPAQAIPAFAIPAVSPLVAAPAQPAREAVYSPSSALRAMSTPEFAPVSGRVFDGALGQSAASGASPVRDDSAGASAAPPNLNRPGLAKRVGHFLWGKPGSVERRIKNGFLVGTLSGLALPYFLKMRPLDFIAVQSILPLAAAAAWVFLGAPLAALSRWVARTVRGNKEPLRVGPRVRRLVARWAVALAMAVSLVPHIEHDRFIVNGYQLVSEHVRVNINGKLYDPQLRLVGPTLSRRFVGDMAANAEGRRILRELTDVTGRLAMPSFFVFTPPDGVAGTSDVAAYIRYADIVLISDKLITRYGWTVDEFLASADKQAAFVDLNQAGLAHEAVHTAQDRRSLFLKSHYHVDTYEAEYEAYLRQHLYLHDMLKQNLSRKDIPAAEFAEYKGILDGGLQPYLDASLNAAEYKMIAKHIDYPPYNLLLKQVQSTWREHRIEGYELIAKRSAGTPDEKASIDKAEALRVEIKAPQPVEGSGSLKSSGTVSKSEAIPQPGTAASPASGWKVKVKVDSKGLVVDADWKDPAVPKK